MLRGLALNLESSPRFLVRRSIEVSECCTISPLHANSQVANSQRCARAFRPGQA